MKQSILILSLVLSITITSAQTKYYGTTEVTVINKDSTFTEKLQGVYFEFRGKWKILYHQGLETFELSLKGDSVYVPTRNLKYKLTITDTELILSRPGHKTTFKLHEIHKK